MTLSEIRARVRDWLAEPDTAGFYSDAMLNRLINDAQREFARKTACMEQSTTIAVSSGTQEYALPSDFLFPTRVQLPYLSTPYTLRPISFKQANPGTSVGTPYSYYVRGSYIGFHPTPDAANTVTLYYVENPDDVSLDNSQMNIPTRFHHMLVPWAVYRARLSDDDKVAGAQAAKAEWEQFIADARLQLQTQGHDTYPLTPDAWDSEETDV